MVTSTIQEQGKLSGALGGQPILRGIASPIYELVGSIKIASAELQGKISTSTSLKGSIEQESSLNAILTIPTSLSTEDVYKGSYQVTPHTISQELKTKDKIMTDNVHILAIPYYETSNLTGKTVYIGGE